VNADSLIRRASFSERYLADLCRYCNSTGYTAVAVELLDGGERVFEYAPRQCRRCGGLSRAFLESVAS
jgi:hypothetical protein